MTSLVRVEANRINAAKSTGPRTPRGKAVARLNAVRHGINSCLPVLTRGESRTKWEKFAAAIVSDLEPAGPLETVWAARIALLQWRLLHCADARQTLANQQWREAAMAAPQSAWWQHRQQQEQGLPASLVEHRKQMRENKRVQTLLARVVAFSAAPTPGERSFRVPPPERRADGATAMALLQRAADHLELDNVLHTTVDGRCRCPGFGLIDNPLEPIRCSWDLAMVHEAVTEVGSWGEHTFDELASALGPSLRDAFNQMRRAARRAEKEMRQFRLCSAAKPSEESTKFDRYEADLERRLYLATNQLRALQIERGANGDTEGANVGQNVAQSGFASLETSEKPQ